jgi:hypothetical protein
MNLHRGTGNGSSRNTRFDLIYTGLRKQATTPLSYPLRLKKPDGAIVWALTEAILIASPANNKAATLEEYVKNPEVLRAAFTNAAAIVSRWIVDCPLSIKSDRH